MFSLNYSKNIKSNLSHYYPEPIGDNNQYSFKNQNLSFFEKLSDFFPIF